MYKKVIALFLVLCMLPLAGLPSAAADEPLRYGDLTLDGEVEVDDARYVLRASVGLENYAPGSDDFRRADADGNGEIEVSDARLVLRVSVGLQDYLPAELDYVSPNGYAREEDAYVYDAVLGDYARLLEKANAAQDPDERFVLFAQAEAALLDAAVMIPTSSQGGAYTISRIAPRTVPYVQWGSDDARLKGMVISDELLTPAERDALLSQWDEAAHGRGVYDPAAWLIANGHAVQTDYIATYSTDLWTLDWLATSSQEDTEILVNLADGLVEYNNLGQIVPALAESWEISGDGTVCTFHIRRDANWFNYDGSVYAPVTANDFAAGFRHMLDLRAGLEYLTDGVIAGAMNYARGGGSWEDVGVRATDPYTLQITLERPVAYFMSMLTYSCFLPICEKFYNEVCGIYGPDAVDAAMEDGSYYEGGFADPNDVSTQVYCGAFLPIWEQTGEEDRNLLLTKNERYYQTDEVKLSTVRWVHDNGEDPDAYYSAVLDGYFPGIALSAATGLLDRAKKDGIFQKYAYVSETNSTTYFGGLNLDRGIFALENGAVASPKTDAQKTDAAKALLNRNFRKALMYAFDKAAQNATSRGEDLKNVNLRNMFCMPDLVRLSKPVTDKSGHTFPAGAAYGELVQYYVDALGLGIDVSDGTDGWFRPEKAKEAMAAAKEELGDKVSFPIQIDVVYYANAAANTAQAEVYKYVIEKTLGTENVVVNLLAAESPEDFYACGYRAANGAEGNFDMFYGSGWGPDYGDPSTYLNTFLPDGAGYMTKVIGLF